MDTKLERFDVPTREALKDLPRVTDEEIDAILVVFADEDATHEEILQRCDKILDAHGVVSLEIEDARRYTDDGIRFCPPFSYVNMGDPYVATLARDHEHGKWVVAGWADMAEDYARAHKIGSFEEYEKKPERCRDCHGESFTFETNAEHATDGQIDRWFECDECGEHHTASDDYKPAEDEETDTK